MTVRIGDIAFDCDDAIKVATFWSGVLQRRSTLQRSALFARSSEPTVNGTGIW